MPTMLTRRLIKQSNSKIRCIHTYIRSNKAHYVLLPNFLQANILLLLVHKKIATKKQKTAGREQSAYKSIVPVIVNINEVLSDPLAVSGY